MKTDTDTTQRAEGSLHPICSPALTDLDFEAVFPSRCPVTGLPYFMTLELDGVMVPTYGGPEDSMTLPDWHDDDQCWYWMRYDHHNGSWNEGVEFFDAPAPSWANAELSDSRQ